MNRARVEVLALSLPGATKVTLWGRLDVYKVRGKVFASCGDEEGLSFKATDIAYAVLTDGGPGRPAPGFARGRWVNIALHELDDEDAPGWLATSHRLAAEGLSRKQRAELGI